jgi:hypothetical protein
MLMATIEGADYGRLMGRGTGWVERRYDKGSGGGGAQLGGGGGEPMMV